MVYERIEKRIDDCLFVATIILPFNCLNLKTLARRHFEAVDVSKEDIGST